LKPAARLNPIEIAVDVELQQHRRLIRRPASGLRLDAAKPKRGQIELVDKHVDCTNRIVLADPILQIFRKQRALPAIYPFNEALHPIPRKIARESYPENHFNQHVFTQPGSFASLRNCGQYVCFSLVSYRTSALLSNQG